MAVLVKGKQVDTRPAPSLFGTADGLLNGRGKQGFVRWSVPMLNQITMGVDVALLLAASWLAGPPSLSQLSPGWFHAWLAAAFLTVAAHWILVRLGSYSLVRLRKRARPLLDAVLAVAVTAGAGALAAWMLDQLPRVDAIWLATWAGFDILLIAAWRQVVRVLAEQGVRSGSLLRKVAIVGATDLAETLAAQLSNPSLDEPCQLIGVFDDRGPDRRPFTIGNHIVAGTVGSLCDYAENHPVDLIVIALPWTRAAQIWAMIEQVQWISADVMIPTSPDVFNPRVAQMAAVAGQPALQVMRQPLQGARALLKVAEDYVVGILALFPALPILAIAAIAIRLDSPGPILFRQKRVGFNHQVFDIFKLRTMMVNNEDRGIVGVGKGDPRITRVGAILRRLSLDELPQLFNVLRGEMSIVGPRPHVPGMKVGAEGYTRAVSDYAARHRIKPGITGWAQINGMRGGIHTIEKARRGVDFDMHYIENWSIWFDIRIMARTLLIGMAGRDVF